MNCLENLNREKLKDKKRIVIKVGTSSLTYANGKVNFRFLEKLVRELSDLHNRGIQIILVSSGAIGVGAPVLGFKEKPSYLPYKQAAAAVGQGILMNYYERYFRDYGQVTAQMLLTKGDAINSKHYLYTKGTLQSLLELGAIPIINENDAVTAEEIKIGDNDTLSAIVASIADADLLVILSDIDGLYSGIPGTDPNAKLISFVPEFSREILHLAGGAGTARGTGGMYTKLLAAEICVRSGIDMVIAKSSLPHVITRILDGDAVGTLFLGENVHPQLKKRDIIIGTAVRGKVFVDRGCMEAILNKGSSLLPVGVIRVSGQFNDGDIVSVYYDNTEIARGLTHYGSADIDCIKGHHTEELSEVLGYEAPYDTIIHRDNLLIMR